MMLSRTCVYCYTSFSLDVQWHEHDTTSWLEVGDGDGNNLVFFGTGAEVRAFLVGLADAVTDDDLSLSE